jgi:hypothetical protein
MFVCRVCRGTTHLVAAHDMRGKRCTNSTVFGLCIPRPQPIESTSVGQGFAFHIGSDPWLVVVKLAIAAPVEHPVDFQDVRIRIRAGELCKARKLQSAQSSTSTTVT